MRLRQVYVVENQDWLAPKSNLTNHQAYNAVVALYGTVTDEQWRIACADLRNAGLPVNERHERYVTMTGEQR